jgi:hypothetical protein
MSTPSNVADLTQADWDAAFDAHDAYVREHSIEWVYDEEAARLQVIKERQRIAFVGQ